MVKRSVYNIEKVLAERAGPKEAEFFVKWRGKGSTDNSWVPESEFGNARFLLHAFRRDKDQPQPYRRGSFSLEDVPKQVMGLVYDPESQRLLAEVRWKSKRLSNAVYAVDDLHELCPSLMCKFYRSHLKLVQISER